MKIDFQFFKQEYKERGELFQKAIEKIFKSGWYILGNEVKQFENKFSKLLNIKYCIGVANGLEAIQISLMALEIQEGDEVITTPLSAIATTLAIIAVGATPVFVDTDENGLIDINKIESAVTGKTKAILPVHLYGNAVDLDKLSTIIKKHKLFLVEDAAQAHGASINNKFLGTFGEFGCFSFYPTKNLGAIGDAGAIVTNNLILAKKAREIRDYGQSKKYFHTSYGLNSRLDEIQAAILNKKINYLMSDNKKREEIASIYNSLKNIDQLKILDLMKESISSRHQFVIKVKNRGTFISYLKKHGIDTLIHYPILITDQPLFKGKYSSLYLPTAKTFVNEIVSLPIHPFISEKEALYVVKVIRKYFNEI